jgi:hypothetical protein
MGIGETKRVCAADTEGGSRHPRIGRGLRVQGDIPFVCSCATPYALGGNTFEDLDTVDEMLEVGHCPDQDFKFIFLGLYLGCVGSGRVVSCVG